MARAETPSFVCEFEVLTSAGDRRTLRVRFDCARQIYNAVLGEALRRLRRMRDSKAFHTAREMPRATKAEKTARSKVFRGLETQFGFREYDLHSWARPFTESWLGEHVDAILAQTLATRAFKAARRYALGKAGRPRFKGKNQLDSIEGKNDNAGLLWRMDRFGFALRWGELEMPAVIDAGDVYHRHALSHRVKYGRLVRRKIRGRDRYFCQLVLEGAPYQDPSLRRGVGVVGLDLGPSHIAIVAPDAGVLKDVPFAPGVDEDAAEVRRLRRQADRQLRAANPGNYLRDGRVRLGRKTWSISKGLEETRSKLAEAERRLAEHRKSEHGRLANECLAYGNEFNLEKVSYRAWQRVFGRSVRRKAPAMFVSKLRRKAGSADGAVIEFSTRTTALSQSCLCPAKVKKDLSERVHRCSCGIVAPRDLFSAYLAVHVHDEQLDRVGAQAGFGGVEARLRAAVEEGGRGSRGLKTASGSPSATPRAGRAASSEPFVRALKKAQREAADAVASPVRVRESRGEPACPSGTPAL